MLPSSLLEEDVVILLNEVVRTMNMQSSARILSTFVISEKFISGCLALFDDIMQQKAQKVRFFYNLNGSVKLHPL